MLGSRAHHRLYTGLQVSIPRGEALFPQIWNTFDFIFRDPFVMPAQPAMKLAAKQARRAFAANTFSDHMVLLRAFQVMQSLLVKTSL